MSNVATKSDNTTALMSGDAEFEYHYNPVSNTTTLISKDNKTGGTVMVLKGDKRYNQSSNQNTVTFACRGLWESVFPQGDPKVLDSIITKHGKVFSAVASATDTSITVLSVDGGVKVLCVFCNRSATELKDFRKDTRFAKILKLEL